MKTILFFLLVCQQAFAQDYVANWNSVDSAVENYEVDFSTSGSSWSAIAQIPKGNNAYTYTLPYKPGYYKIKGAGSDIYSNTILLTISFSVSITNPVYKLTSLTWSTSDESNVSYYLIQKSYDGKNYSKTTTVSAKGSGSYTYRLSRTMRRYIYRITPVYKDGSIGQFIIFK